MTSEVEGRPKLVTGGYGRHRHQWVNTRKEDNFDILTFSLGSEPWGAKEKKSVIVIIIK